MTNAMLYSGVGRWQSRLVKLHTQ